MEIYIFYNWKINIDEGRIVFEITKKLHLIFFKTKEFIDDLGQYSATFAIYDFWSGNYRLKAFLYVSAVSSSK